MHWKDWCWSWNSSPLATWCEEWTPWKRPWCWERLKAGEGDDRGWDGWMASPTQWTWVWASSGSWWWTGKPGVLQSMGSQRVGHHWVTELNWCPSIWSCHPAISSSVFLFSFRLHVSQCQKGGVRGYKLAAWGLCIRCQCFYCCFFHSLTLVCPASVFTSRCLSFLVPFFGRVQVPFAHGCCELFARVTHMSCQNDAWCAISTAEHWMVEAQHTESGVGEVLYGTWNTGKAPGGRFHAPISVEGQKAWRRGQWDLWNGWQWKSTTCG